MQRKYKDEQGYNRGEVTPLEHSTKVSRQIAYEHIYKKNRDKYPRPFKEYQVHHIDRDKTNDDIHNLQIVTPIEHRQIHGIREKDKKLTSYDSAGALEEYYVSDIKKQSEPKEKQKKSNTPTFKQIVWIIIISLVIVVITLPDRLSMIRDIFYMLFGLAVIIGFVWLVLISAPRYRR